MNLIPCKTCTGGQMRPMRIYRMSAPVVVIGWLFLLPSFFGIAVSALMAFGMVVGGAASMSAPPPPDLVAEIRAAGTPAALVAKIEKGTPLSAAEEREMPQSARERLDNYTVAKVGAGGAAVTMGVGFAGFIGCSSFTGGLLGWLLTMKRNVLMCGSCQSIVDRA